MPQTTPDMDLNAPVPTAELLAPVFVVGHARSGTTLLATMLGRHPRLAATPESHFFNEGRYALAPWYHAGPAKVADRIASTRLRHFGFSQQALQALLKDAPMTDRGVLTALLTAYLDQSGKGRIVEKTPVHIRHIDDILACLPTSRIIWIQRDGRACIASLRKVDWASDDVTILARQWTRNMAFGLAAQRRHPDRILTLRYEDLTGRPESEMTRILDWLGEPFAAAVLDASQAVTTISQAEEGWKANVRKPITADRAEAWRTELTAEQILVAQNIMGPMLRAMGYPAPLARGAPALLEGLRNAVINGGVGVRAQKRLYDRIAHRRFSPWGANQGTKGQPEPENG